MRSWYDNGSLFAGDLEGVTTWVVESLGEWWYGPALGPLFSDAVISGWQRYDPTQYVPPIA